MPAAYGIPVTCHVMCVTRHSNLGVTMSDTTPTLVTVPCFSGAPLDASQLAALQPYPVRTMRLPEGLDSVEAYADFVATQVTDLDDFVLIGDSFGAVISLTLALRQPAGMRGLALSGGF